MKYHPASDSASLTFLCYGMRFHIVVARSNLCSDPGLNGDFWGLTVELDPERMYRAFSPDDEDEDGGGGGGGGDEDPREKLAFWIAGLCREQLRDLSERTVKIRPINSLHEYLNIETLVVVLHARNGGVDGDSYWAGEDIMREITPRAALPLSLPVSLLSRLGFGFGFGIGIGIGTWLWLGLGLGLPLLRTWEVFFADSVVEDEDGLPWRANKVLTASGGLRFFKPTFDGRDAELEISTLLKIRNLEGRSIRVPGIQELVQADENIHPNTLCISGILLEYVEHRGALSDFDLRDFSKDVRRRWMRELEDGIMCLHAAGIVWGDAQPKNILVDNEDNLWLIGFSGDSDGWVDEDKVRTVEGDVQALNKMLECFEPRKKDS